SEEAVDEFLSVGADVGIVVAYGLILPQVILDGPKLGCFNLHASLLPRWRGAAPIQRSIMAGDTLTGVQVMRMERGLDTGPILLSATTPIAATDTAGTLHDRLAQTGAQILPQFLAALDRESISETPQSEEGVTYAEKITIDEARIDWSQPAPIVDQMIRGLSPAPGAFYETDSPASGRTRIKVLMSRVCDASSGVDTSAAPGTVVRAKGVVTVACGQGAVDLIRLQRSGKKAQEADVFLRGFPIAEGTTLCRP
ncbi:MAG: methionyl-tRNA formyltransferase, partial [Pseudomonadota bacterium]